MKTIGCYSKISTHESCAFLPSRSFSVHPGVCLDTNLNGARKCQREIEEERKGRKTQRARLNESDLSIQTCVRTREWTLDRRRIDRLIYTETDVQGYS